MKLKATSFATDQDLIAWDKCKDAVHTDSYCWSTPGGGDNGEGKWGDDTTSRTHAFCALGPSLQKKHQSIKVTLFHKDGTKMGKSFICKQGDGGNEDKIDLNPGSLLSAGLDPNTELDAVASIEFID